jgi:hypothetical protein
MPRAKPKTYEVTFYRELVGNNGRRFESPLSKVRIETAASRDEAVAAAVHRFEHDNRLQRWDFLATGINVSRIRPGAGQ